MKLPENIVWAVYRSGRYDELNIIYVYCDESKRETIVKLIKEKYLDYYTSTVRDEIKSCKSWDDEDPILIKLGEEEDPFYDGFEDEFGMDIAKLKLENVLDLTTVHDGLVLRPKYLSVSIEDGDIYHAGDINPFKILKKILKGYRDVYYEGYIGYTWTDKHDGEAEQYEYSSKTRSYKETDKVYDHVGEIIAESMMCSDFWNELCYLDDDDIESILEFFKAYSKWISEEAYDHLLEIANNNDSQNLIPEILECKNKHFPKTGDNDLTKELALD